MAWGTVRGSLSGEVTAEIRYEWGGRYGCLCTQEGCVWGLLSDWRIWMRESNFLTNENI